MVVRSGGDVSDVRCSGADGDSEWCVNIMVTRVAGGSDGDGGGERGGVDPGLTLHSPAIMTLPVALIESRGSPRCSIASRPPVLPFPHLSFFQRLARLYYLVFLLFLPFIKLHSFPVTVFGYHFLFYFSLFRFSLFFFFFSLYFFLSMYLLFHPPFFSDITFFFSFPVSFFIIFHLFYFFAFTLSSFGFNLPLDLFLFSFPLSLVSSSPLSSHLLSSSFSLSITSLLSFLFFLLFPSPVSFLLFRLSFFNVTPFQICALAVYRLLFSVSLSTYLIQ